MGSGEVRTEEQTGGPSRPGGRHSHSLKSGVETPCSREKADVTKERLSLGRTEDRAIVGHRPFP